MRVSTRWALSEGAAGWLRAEGVLCTDLRGRDERCVLTAAGTTSKDRALALSEATFGAAQGASPALGLILGTGVAGGVVLAGRLMPGRAGFGGEFLLREPSGFPMRRCR